VNIAGYGKGVVSLVFFKKVEEASPLVRSVRPVFHALFIGKELNATRDDTHVGWNLELGLQPFLLSIAQKGFGSVGGGFIPPSRADTFGLCLLKF
jgi:hypothetical protein